MCNRAVTHEMEIMFYVMLSHSDTRKFIRVYGKNRIAILSMIFGHSILFFQIFSKNIFLFFLLKFRFNLHSIKIFLDKNSFFS